MDANNLDRLKIWLHKQMCVWEKCTGGYQTPRQLLHHEALPRCKFWQDAAARAEASLHAVARALS